MKSQLYNHFWQRLHSHAKDKGFPLRVMFELTYRCNFNCAHCYVPKSYRKKRELKTKEVLSVLDALRDIGCFYLGFTGGELFLRKDITRILWYAKRKGFEIIIYSNGSLINEALADELADLRPNKVDITIQGMSKTSFERISGLAGSRDKVFNAIDWLYKRKVNLGFKTCVLKENESEIKDIQDFARSLGALHRLDDTLSAALDGSKEPYEYRGNANLRESIDANLRECNEIISENSRSNISVNSRPKISENSRSKIRVHSRLFKCGVGVSQAAVTPQGELKLCLMIDSPRFKIFREGKKQGADLKTAWLELKEFVAGIKPDENYNCVKCGLENYCQWCPAKSWLSNKTWTSCEPESKKKAELLWTKSNTKTLV